MYLKRLDVCGFKSFADKIDLEFMPGITAVIGPNGSGKSNISDAVRWVLGEQSIRSLRGSKLEDVIFAGTQSRKPLNFAEVSLTVDNQSRSLPVDYSEVTITRRVYRSGESEFLINKTPCRLKDINELFMGTGVGRDGYSIIGQGRIDEILSSNSEDRRAIFEEAAGITKYKTRKIEAERKLEATKQNLERIQDIVTEIESNLGPLKNQKEQAEKYLELKVVLKDYEINLFIDDVTKLKEKLEEIVEQIEQLEQNIVMNETDLANFEQKKNEIKVQFDDTLQDISNLQEQIYLDKTSIEKLNSDISLFNQKIQSNKENAQRLKDEIIELQTKKEYGTVEIEDKKKRIEFYKKSKQEYLQKQELQQDELETLTVAIDQEEAYVENVKTDLIEKMNEVSDKKVKINSYITLDSSNIKRQEQLLAEERTLILELDKSNMKKEELIDSVKNIRIQKTKDSAKMEELKLKQQELSQKLNVVKTSIKNNEYELSIKKSRHKFLSDTEKENEGYFKSVKSVLDQCDKDKSFGKGIHGALAKLINVNKEYEIAVEMALGSGLQDIVVDSENEGKRAIEYLKYNKLGRATFLPISTVRSRDNNIYLQSIEKVDGFVGLASNLIQCDNLYREIVNSLLGRTLIVTNLDVGIKVSKMISNGFKIVTIDGDIINTSGTMTGGSINQKNISLLGRTREIQELAEKIAQMQTELDRFFKQEKEFDSSLAALIDEINLLNEEIKNKDITLALEQEKLLSNEALIQRLIATQQNIKLENNQIEEQKNLVKTEVGELNIQIQKLQEEMITLQNIIENYKARNKEKVLEKEKLIKEMENLKVSISSFDESILDVQETLDKMIFESNNVEKGIERRHKEKQTNIDENIELENNIKKTEENIAVYQQKINECEIKLENMKLSKEESSQQITQIDKDILQKIKQIEEQKQNRTKQDVKKVKYEFEIENYQNRMWEEYEITFNNVLELKKDLGSITKINETINSLKAKIKSLGNVNIAAIEEYTNLKERYDFISVQKNDLEEAEQKLRKVIVEMTGIMKTQFSEQFKLINKNFSEVFIELFSGGRAELKLTDEQDVLNSGIEIEVQPPGKKLQNMMLLSGGEKAFTAIALLFGILRLNPSPFCILDEIEAALDDINVYRFAEYVKRFVDKTQFIIVTHRKGTMEAANTLYGVTMQEHGVSKLISMKVGA